jgi:proline iminopeptidase
MLLEVLAMWLGGAAMAAELSPRADTPQVAGAALHVRVHGKGPPTAIVLHGGPDFDSSYLLPDFDQFGDLFQLVYYDQRGRGASAAGVRPEDVSLDSEMRDLDDVLRRHAPGKAVLIGHSWGTVLALEYALRHPANISKLILLNPAPASAADYGLLGEFYRKKIGGDMARQREIARGDAYRAGDPAAVTARYRIHFKPAFVKPEVYESLIARMDVAFRQQGAAGILKAREVEDRLYLETWQKPGYDLHPQLRTVRIPTLIVTGREDFIPVEIAEHAAAAMPSAELRVIDGCGHFSFMECPGELRAALEKFLTAR